MRDPWFWFWVTVFVLNLANYPRKDGGSWLSSWVFGSGRP